MRKVRAVRMAPQAPSTSPPPARQAKVSQINLNLNVLLRQKKDVERELYAPRDSSPPPLRAALRACVLRRRPLALLRAPAAQRASPPPQERLPAGERVPSTPFFGI